MKHKHEKPENAETLTTYTEFRQNVRAFASGHFGLTILIGRPGIAKSKAVRQATENNSVCWIEGHATPFAIYSDLCKHQSTPVVLDDAEGLYASLDGIRLLKELCQTDTEKTVSWNTRAADHAGLPRKFVTRSRVCIVTNSWKTLNVHVEALEDRAHVICFEPTAREIHREVATWFWDQLIYDWIAAHLHRIDRLSMRLYYKAWEKKGAGLDWRSFVLGSFLSGAALLVARLKADMSYPTEEDRVRAFVEQGGGCRATYFNHARNLQPGTEVPCLTLTARPPASGLSEQDVRALLRKHWGEVGNN
jgi:hypothetical protein